MIDLYITLLCIAFMLMINANAIIGFYTATRKGMLLDFIPKWSYSLPEKLKMPLFDCPMCMASVHSLYVFFPIALNYNIAPFWWFIYVLALCGTVKIFMSDLDFGDELEEHTEEKGFK